jgi:peroxiredoxin
VLKADAGGRFALEEKHLAAAVTLRARQGELATPTGTIVTGGEDVTLRLRKDALVSLTGRVTDAAGKPIAGAEVSLIEWAYDAGHGSGTATADRDGRYAFASLWPDLHYSVLATAQGYGRNSSGRLRLRPGETREVASLALKPAGRTLTGRVVDANGNPVVGVQVNLNGRETFSQRPASTDGEGRFRFENVVNEKLRIAVNPAKDQWIDKNVPEGSSDVIIVVPGKGEKSSADEGPKEEFETLLGREAPPLQAVAWVNSSPRTMQQLRGKVVLIDFWGIGCGPCVASLPGVQRAADQFKSKGVVVIGLHNSGATPAKLREFAKQHKLTYPLAIDGPDTRKLSFGKTFRQYTVQGIPAVAVIDRHGKVAYLGHSLEEAVGTLGPLLGPSPRPRSN